MQRIITSFIFLVLPLSATAGNCIGGTATQFNTNGLSDRTICGSAGSDSWQEWHQASGTLTEYARGPGHPVDPTHDVGTWTANGSTVTYNYTGGTSYTFEIWRISNSTVKYCEAGSGTNVIADITSFSVGQQACP